MADQGSAGPAPETQPAAELLPLVYAELRRLAAVLAGRLPPGQTLTATALVHEAYLRLVGDQDPGWQGRRHFFGAAARAMRQILIDQARRKASYKHGGQGRRVELAEGMRRLVQAGQVRRVAKLRDKPRTPAQVERRQTARAPDLAGDPKPGAGCPAPPRRRPPCPPRRCSARCGSGRPAKMTR